MKAEFFFDLTQKNKNGKACFPLLPLLFLIFTSLFNKSSLAQCNNVDFENCDFTGWRASYSQNTGATRTCNVATCNVNGGVASGNPYRFSGFNLGVNNSASNVSPWSEHAIMTGGNDPYQSSLKVVDPLKPGSCSARLGNDLAYGGGGTLQYSWVVTTSNNSFTYDYAVVMADPGAIHNGVQEPHFKINMWAYKNPGDSGPDSTLISCASYQATPDQAPGFLNATVRSPYGDAVIYKPWSTVTIPLDNFIGKTVKIVFETKDCCPGCNGIQNTGSHWTYAYIDCSCAPLEIIPVPPVGCSIPNKLIAPAGAASYTWRGPSIVSGASTRTVTINGPGTYTVNMTTFGQTTCTYSRTVTVSSLPAGHPNFSATTPCVGTATAFTDISTIVAGTTYTWDFGDGTPTSSVQNPTHTYSAAGTYSVNLALASTCPKDTTINVKVLAYPTSTFTTQTVCVNAGSNIAYTDSAPVGSTFTWNFDGGTIISGSGQGPYEVSWPSAGTKNVSLSVNNGGCISTNTVATVVNPKPAVTASSSSICNGLSSTITAGGADTYVWSTGSTTSTMTASPTVTTTYTVIGTSLGCADTTVGTIDVRYAPVVAVNPATVCMGGSATLTASGASGYSWSTGSTANPITVTPASTTTYTVSGTGCPNTTTVTVTVNPIPTVTAAPTTICAGAFTTLTANGAYSYTWSTGGTTSSVTVNPIPTTTYTVIGNSLGCVDTATVTVTTKIAPTLIVASTTICKGEQTTLTVSGAASYTWSTGATTASITASPAVTTTYTITGVQVGIACPGTITATITVNPLPVVSVISDTICNEQGGPGTLTASGADAYSWSTGATTADITASPTVTTTYTVTGNSLGCLGTATGTITVNPVPTVTVSSATVCEGFVATLTAGSADSYLWSTGATTASISQSPVLSTVYSVTGTSLGCYQTASGTVTVLLPPTVEVMPPSICVGQTASLFASGAPSYTWDNGSTTNPLVVHPTSTTTYTVEGEGCPNTTTVTVTVNSMPVISASSTTVCDGTLATIRAFDDGTISSYSWSTGSDSIAIAEAPHTTTTYTVVGTTVFGCKDTAVGTIVVEPNPVVKVSSASACPNAAASISASGADSYLWSTGETTPSITASPASTTSYSVTGTSIWGCSGSGIGTIRITPPPIAGFIASPNPTSMFDTEIHFSNQSSVDVVYWHWDYGDGDTLAPNTASPIHTYTQEVARYTVTLIVHNSTPCWDTISSEIFIGPEFAFYIPNSFTPNGDKNNNGFRGTGVGIVVYKLQIFDRWGDLVWQSTELDEYWNGKANGGSNVVQEDVYVWKVFLTDVFGREHFYIGTVTAVK